VSIAALFVGLILIAACWCGAAEPKSAGKSVVADGAKPVKIDGKFRFTEGPAVDAKGNVFFTDIPKNLIYKYSLDGKLSVWRKDTGGANGLFVDAKGNLLACEGNRGRVTSTTPKGEVSVLADKYEGKRFNKPNDLWIDSAGGIYFTDPVYGRFKVTQGGQHVYYISPDGKKVTRVIDDMTKPNGIVGTPDGKFLYVADHGGAKVYRYRIARISLPVVGAKPASAAKLLVVNVLVRIGDKKAPRFVVSGRPVDLKQLRKVLEDRLQANPKQKVLVRGDKKALHGDVASAIAACRDGGVHQANISYSDPKTGGAVRLVDKKLIAKVACDGMTLDNEGNVYLTERDVLVYNSDGKFIEKIDVPMRPSNACFGGADMKTLFVTGVGATCTVKMRVKGVRTKLP